MLCSCLQCSSNETVLLSKADRSRPTQHYMSSCNDTGSLHFKKQTLTRGKHCLEHREPLWCKSWQTLLKLQERHLLRVQHNLRSSNLSPIKREYATSQLVVNSNLTQSHTVSEPTWFICQKLPPGHSPVSFNTLTSSPCEYIDEFLYCQKLDTLH